MSLEHLRARSPELAAWIDAAPEPRSRARAPGPHVALVLEGIRLASAHDPRSEAELQARLVPPSAERATLYGFAQGEIVRVLLARPALRRLTVVLLNPMVVREVARTFDLEWLADPRVELVRPEGRDELEFPFAASPGDLALAADAAARLRDLVRLELATPMIRRHQHARSEDLATRIAANEARFASDGDVGELFGTRSGAALCVAAAGPTLARHYEELRARARDLVAVDAALKPLLAAGVRPAFVVSIDPHTTGMRRVFEVSHQGLEGTCLVYFPELPGEVLAGWPGARRAARGTSALHARVPDVHGRARLFSSGSVFHPAVDLACRLGAARVELFGADFALCGGHSHVAGCAWERPRAGDTTWVLNGRGERVPSLANLVGYLRDFERYVERHPEVEFVTRSSEGAAMRGVRLEEASDVAR